MKLLLKPFKTERLLLSQHLKNIYVEIKSIKGSLKNTQLHNFRTKKSQVILGKKVKSVSTLFPIHKYKTEILEYLKHRTRSKLLSRITY